MKKNRQQSNATMTAANEFLASFDDIGVDVLPNILGFLPTEDIIRARVSKKIREAATKTIVPLVDFCVNSVSNYNTMRVMTTVLPNLQQITIGKLGLGHKYSDGEDPYERDAPIFFDFTMDPDEFIADRTARYTTHDIGIISNFRKLRILSIDESAPLNGRYPVFFNFPLLQKLSIHIHYLKWDLEMLAGLPLLKELTFFNNTLMMSNIGLTGNINNLRVLKDTLEKVEICGCFDVKGNLMDLADFPHLKKLDLFGTAVTGDIRDIGENHFSSLEELLLPKFVYGGCGYELQRISDAPDLVSAVYHLKTQRSALKMQYCDAYLSDDSPDSYESADDDLDTPPFCIRFVEAGSRFGYRWETLDRTGFCEVNWLDPKPDRESSDYEVIEEQVTIYRGFYEPPTEEEYLRLRA